ncbi:hypothetical protein VB711_13390 [Cronbergia sp. UHCC 0137]|uniref:hypothetical protein n=1 Tax=Cronbergia sp. UHCC 0137 TaxID=3110239 RepID=UPI002B1F19E6|nr:hypothetical protein [Cronbergia sp. UHCC 0137]MEA5618825.1 hypothetical protein [Cronbergia sp. UHCC 0137]
MAKIIISDLVLSNSENLIEDLDEIEAMSVFGGERDPFYIFQFAIKLMEFMLIAYAIDSISDLVTYFSFRNKY